MSNTTRKRKKNITEGIKQSKREYAVRYYAERDYRKNDAPGGVDAKELKKNWKHVVSYSMSEGDLAQKLATSVTYIRYLRRKVAICQKHGVTDPAEIYKLSAGVGEKTLKAFFESKGPVKGKSKATPKGSSSTSKKSSKKSSGKKKAVKKSKKAAKKKAAKKSKKAAKSKKTAKKARK
tara:strand:+ start:2794 stop:3327 length:534 start_codon:yes stop_codon:yes gene_type:complete